MRLALLLISALLLGCDSREAQAPVRAAALTHGKASYVTHDIDGVGRVTVVEVPVGGLKHATEYQTCFIYTAGPAFGFECPNDRRSYTLDPPTN